jgi:two-component system nitrate/nitrite response regulator NarP
MTRVLLADDHPIILSGIEAILRDTGYAVVAKLDNGADALEAIPAARPDILVLDVSMPERSGLDVLRTLRARGDMRPVVLLTASLENSDLLEAIRLQVNGIVLKDGAQALLTRCLDAVRAGGRWIEKSLLERALDLTMNGGARTEPFAGLTPRERAIVGLVAQGLRNRDVGSELGITEGTVKVYLHRIYEKLGVGSRTELAIYAKDVAQN